jgi:hypothetical protein
MPSATSPVQVSTISSTIAGARPSDGSSQEQPRIGEEGAADRQHLLLVGFLARGERADLVAEAGGDRTGDGGHLEHLVSGRRLRSSTPGACSCFSFVSSAADTLAP